MPSFPEDRRVIRFGVFELDVRAGELRKQGLKTRLPPQSFQVLLMLLEARGGVVTRDALRRKLWAVDTFVDFDTGLGSAVKRLRDALGDSAENPRFVETLPRRGYRFIADITPPVRADSEASAAPPPALPAAPSGRRPLALAAAGLLVIALAALAAGGRWPFRTTRAAPIQIQSVAVLPLENLSGDPGQDYFADGMTDALITELAQIRGLRVISRTSVMAYRGTDKPVGAIARELGVDAVVEGTVARVGERVRITAQLIHAPTDRHLWARSYERELRDVLALQGEIAAAVAQAVESEIRPGERGRAGRRVDPEVYEAYLRGRFHWSARETGGLYKAIDYFTEAVRKDPTYAPGYSGLSDTYRLFDMHGLMPPRDSMPRAEAAARRAIALDDGLAEAHASLAGVLYRYDWNWPEAEREFQRALELDPSYAEAHRAYAVYLLAARRPEQAVVEARRARALSPLSPIVNTELGLALASAGRVDEAIEELKKTAAMDPNFLRVYHSLAIVYERKGDRSGMAEAVASGMSRSRPGQRSNWLGYFCALTGRRRDALAILDELERRSSREYVSPQSFAVVRLGLGEKDQALSLLEKAYDERAIEWLGFATVLTEHLRDEPRFQALVRRMGLHAVGRDS
jgi:TolB-like protein/DNA-binding winged helix-turn-helix (wHTH) protein/Tfp pilus assembly protein PilF